MTRMNYNKYYNNECVTNGWCARDNKIYIFFNIILALRFTDAKSQTLIKAITRLPLCMPVYRSFNTVNSWIFPNCSNNGFRSFSSRFRGICPIKSFMASWSFMVPFSGWIEMDSDPFMGLGNGIWAYWSWCGIRKSGCWVGAAPGPVKSRLEYAGWGGCGCCSLLVSVWVNLAILSWEQTG